MRQISAVHIFIMVSSYEVFQRKFCKHFSIPHATCHAQAKEWRGAVDGTLTSCLERLIRNLIRRPLVLTNVSIIFMSFQENNIIAVN
jgi:hypothetical protein